MKLEDQVCSLELSKRLKGLGVKQESLFWWGRFYSNDLGEDAWVVRDRAGGIHIESSCSAFTVAELGEMLPLFASNTSKTSSGKWRCETDIINGYSIETDTEADARAKMIIYLLENKLITL